jgi:hypothetical protein
VPYDEACTKHIDSELSPTRPTKALPTRRPIPMVVITKRPPTEAKSLRAPETSPPRNTEQIPSPSKNPSLFTPEVTDDDGEDLQSDEDPYPQIPDRPFNIYRVATKTELPPADKPVGIQLGRPRVPGMDLCPYRITSGAARVVARPDGYRVTGFEPFFSFYHKELDCFLLVPPTHCVTGWPMYPGSHRVLAREWSEIDAALKEHVHSRKRKSTHNPPVQDRAKKARQSPSKSPSPLVSSQARQASPELFGETFSDSASNYSTTQKDRRRQGRDYSLSGSDEEPDDDQSPTKPHITPRAGDGLLPRRVEKGKGRAKSPTPGPSTERLLLSDEARGAVLDAVETLMAIAVDYKTDFPTIFAAVDLSVSDFFPPGTGPPAKRLGRPCYNNPFNIWMPYFRVMLDKEGRSKFRSSLLGTIGLPVNRTTLFRVLGGG